MTNTHVGTQSYYKFNFEDLSVVAGGSSVIDQTKLHIFNLDEADAFLRSYGFDLSKESEEQRAWYFHRRALVLLTEKLKFAENEISVDVRDPQKLKDIRNLLIWASDVSQPDRQRWSCAVLRCIHAFIHGEMDLFNEFAEEIQVQILSPFENAIVHEDQMYLRSFKKEGLPQVPLAQFQTKPLKSSSSTVIKMLAKRDVIAMQIMDKIGVRFVTRTVFDSYQVIRFLVEENLISYAHILPDQSSNNLYPVKEFLEVCDKLNRKYGDQHKMSAEKIDRLLRARFNTQKSKGILNLFRKQNAFSSQQFKYIKFIARKLVRISTGPYAGFSFFYPFEVQIIDNDTFSLMQSGDSEHSAYKSRQIDAARKRVYTL